MGWSGILDWTYSALGSDTLARYKNTTSSKKIVKSVSVSLGTGYGSFYAGSSIYGDGSPISVHLVCNGVSSSSVTVSNRVSPTSGYPPKGSGDTYTFSFSGISVPAGGSVSFSIVWPAGQCLVALSDTVSGTVRNADVTVTFDLNGGTRTGGGALTQSVSVGGAATAPTCSRAGYTFTGWNKALSPINSNTTITAQWKLNEVYTVTFNASGGTFGTSSLTFRQGIGVSIPTTKPTKSIILTYDFVCSVFTSNNTSETRWLVFIGWNTKENGSGTHYSPGETIDGSSNITLYAQYSGVTPNLPSLNSSKATLSGWFTRPSGGTQITSSSELRSTQTIYAHYSSYVVTLHANGGVMTLDGSTDDPVSTVDLIKTHGTELTIPNYTAYQTTSETDTSSTEFKGWSTSRNTSTVQYAKGGKYTTDSPATLYAVYGTIQHTVKWSVGYGTSPIIKTETVNHGESANPPKDPTRDGYAFGGWLGEYKSVKSDRTILALWASTPIWIWNGKTWIGYQPEEG